MIAEETMEETATATSPPTKTRTPSAPDCECPVDDLPRRSPRKRLPVSGSPIETTTADTPVAPARQAAVPDIATTFNPITDALPTLGQSAPPPALKARRRSSWRG